MVRAAMMQTIYIKEITQKTSVKEMSLLLFNNFEVLFAYSA